MSRFSVFRRSVFFQLVMGALGVLIGVAALWLGASSYFLHAMDRANERRWMAGAIANQVVQLRIAEKDFLLQTMSDSAFYATGESPSVQAHEASLALTRTWADSLTKLSDGNLRQSAEQLHQNLDAYGTAFRELVTAVRARGYAANARRSTADTALEAKTAEAVAAIDPVLGSIIVESVRDSNVVRYRLIAAVPLILLLGIVLAIGFVYVFARSVSRMTTELERAANDIGQGRFTSRVRGHINNELGRLGDAFNQMADRLALLVGAVHQSSAQINTSTTEIAATAREQQATATEIAATTNQVGATAKAISATSQHLANTVRQVVSVAEETATLAGTGQAGLTQLDATMRQVSEASSAVNARLSVLSEKAGSITSVVTTIVKVADQTNLLSLNAAIEAEKAGEYGRGFAVVATEIRRLADQTATATGDIEQIIKEMQSAVTAGVMGMDKFADEVRRGVDVSDRVSGQLSEIIRKVQALTPHLDAVNDGMQSQTEGAEQISEALSQLSASVKQTADSLVQSNRAIEHLYEAAQNLQSGVSHFSVAT